MKFTELTVLPFDLADEKYLRDGIKEVHSAFGLSKKDVKIRIVTNKIYGQTDVEIRRNEHDPYLANEIRMFLTGFIIGRKTKRN